MPGGLIQLVAVGIQDEKLTQDPEITFFKAAYRPYINFALESIEQTFSGTAGFGRRVQSEMSRNGDLVKDTVLEIELPAVSVSQTGLGAGTAQITGVEFTGQTNALSGGTFQILFDNVPTTSINFNATTAQVQAAVDAVLGSSVVTVALKDGADASIANLAADTANDVFIVLTWTSAASNVVVVTVDFSTLTTATGLVVPSEILTGAITSGVNATAGVAPDAARTAAWAPNIGHRVLKEMSVEIGGQPIDKHYGRWYDIWTELTLPETKRKGFNEMIGQQNLVETAAADASGSSAVTFSYSGLQTLKTSHSATRLYVPLRFWFNCNAGLALPIIALAYHQIKLLFQFSAITECVVYGSGTLSSHITYTPEDFSVSLWVDYVYLDNAERRNYAQTPHEYLIDQLQHAGVESLTGSNSKVRLNFNHPVQELVWAVQEDYVVNEASGSLSKAQQNQHDDYAIRNAAGPAGAAGVGGNPIDVVKLQLNGQDRFAERHGEYFNLVQPYNHHSRVPYKADGKSRGIFVYSFALQPEDYQPCGTANFSRIDSATLNMTLKNVSNDYPAKVYIYARNYNLFRIASGMGGLAYAS